MMRTAMHRAMAPLRSRPPLPSRQFSSGRSATEQGFPQPSAGQVFGGLGVLFVAYTIGESFFAVDAGKVYVCQNNISGTLTLTVHFRCTTLHRACL
jgi:hypothetical protein